MKKLMMLSAVAALVLGGSAYAAGPQDPTVQIKASESSYHMYKGEFDDFANRYALDNGQYIKFTQSGKHYWARLKNEERAELYAVSRNVFVTAAGARIEFKDNGEVVEIMNFERLPMAVAMQGSNVRVVASR